MNVKLGMTELKIEEIFGKLPERPLHLTIDVEAINFCFLNGKAELRELVARIDLGEKEISFPFISITPSNSTVFPAIISIDYEDPRDFEEFIDKGYRIFAFKHSDICKKGDKFSFGIYRDVAGTRKRKNAPGKFIIWTWAAIRLLEYARDLDTVDKNRLFAVGKDKFAISAMLLSQMDGYVDYLYCDDKEKIDALVSEIISVEYIKKNPSLFSASINQISVV